MPLALKEKTFFGEDIGDREFLVEGCEPYGACKNGAHCLAHSEWEDPRFNVPQDLVGASYVNERCRKKGLPKRISKR